MCAVLGWADDLTRTQPLDFQHNVRETLCIHLDVQIMKNNNKKREQFKKDSEMIRQIINQALLAEFDQLDIRPDDWSLEISDCKDDKDAFDYSIILGDDFGCSPNRSIGIARIESSLQLLFDESPSQVSH